MIPRGSQVDGDLYDDDSGWASRSALVIQKRARALLQPQSDHADNPAAVRYAHDAGSSASSSIMVQNRHQPQPDCNTVLNEASARNLPIELHLDDEHGERVVARSRVLAADDEQILLDQALVVGADVDLSIGRQVDAFLWVCDSLYRFNSTIIKPRYYIELNVNKGVVGMALANPGELDSTQRRSHYRVLLAALDPMPVKLHTASQDSTHPCPLDAARHSGDLMDLSLGGAALKVHHARAVRFKLNDPIYLSFNLPASNHQHIMLARVRQARNLPDTGNTRLGVQFLPWPSARHLEAERDVMQRFIARVQREHLRRAG